MNTNKIIEYFDLRKHVLDKSPTTKLIYAIGKRGAGKTYSGKKEAINRYININKKFVYVRRWTTEITAGLLKTVFSDVENDPEIEWNKLEYGYYKYHVLPKSGNFWLVGEDEDGKLHYIDIMGVITCVSDAEHFKGGVYNNYSMIIFDEFITEKGYIHGDKEPDLFDKIVNTVGRSINDELIVYMAGNPDEMVELCPYLYSLKLNYNKLKPNTVYFYDTVTDTDILEKNIAFIKVKVEGDTLNKATSSLFGTAEERMSLSGDTKIHEFINIDYKDHFKPLYELEVELPIIADDEGYWHKKIYVYYGHMWNNIVCVISKHEEYKIDKLFCRYDQNDFRKRSCRQTFRINIPPEEAYAELNKMIHIVDCNKFIITADNEAASAFFQIREAS